MGVHHTFYSEVKFNGEWQWLDPLLPQAYNKEQQKSSAIWGKSWLWNTSEKAQVVGRPLEREDLSKELAAYVFRGSEHWDPLYRPCITELPFGEINELLKNCGGHEHYGFVPKETIAMWETNALFDIYEWLSADEFRKLSKEAQKAYRYYEWDSTDGWVQGFKLLQKIMEVRLSDLDQAGWDDNKIEGARFVVVID